MTHTKLQQLTVDERRDVLGNEAADRHAGIANHETEDYKADAPIIKQYHKDFAILRQIAKVLGTMLQLWPSNKERKLKHERKKRSALAEQEGESATELVEALPLSQRHEWVYRRGEGHVCSKCIAFKHKLDEQARAQPCAGYSSLLAQLVTKPHGHKLVALDCTEATALMCVQCYCWSDTGTKGNLRDKKCTGKPSDTYKKWHDKLFVKRQHPSQTKTDTVHAIIPVSNDAVT